MLLPRLFAAGLWLVATVASTAMVWAATSIVAADVTDRPPSVVTHHDVVSELASGAPAAETAPTTTAPKPESSTSTVPSPGRGPVPAGPDAPVPDAAPSPQPGATAAPFSPPTTAAPSSGPPPDPRPAIPPDPRPTATYSTTGGVVRVACSGFFIELLSAIPSNGYVVDVVASGPGNVDVRFVGPGPDVSVKAVCFGQPIRYYEQTPPTRQGAS